MNQPQLPRGPHGPLAILVAAAAMFLWATLPDAAARTASPEDAAPGALHGLEAASIDRAVLPGDDFFRFANGAWLKSTEIPPDRSSYGPGEVLVELNAKRTAQLIQDAAAHAA